MDQFQKLECLVACARGAAVGPEAPVALRRCHAASRIFCSLKLPFFRLGRLRIDNMMIPVARPFLTTGLSAAL